MTLLIWAANVTTAVTATHLLLRWACQGAPPIGSKQRYR